MSDNALLYIDVPMERHIEGAGFMTVHEQINFLGRKYSEFERRKIISWF